jgi:trk system potassium uptake protein TrkA
LKHKQYAVIGLGRFGTSVATTLNDLGYQVLGIDSDEERIKNCYQTLPQVVQADATKKENLIRLGIQSFDVVIVGIGQNQQASVVATILLKELGVPHVVAKAQNEYHGKLLEKFGADSVVYPERDIGSRIAHNLMVDNVLDYIELSAKLRIVELSTPQKLVGLSLEEADMRTRYSANIVAIKRGDTLISAPIPAERIVSGDVLIIIGDIIGMSRLEQME